MRNVDINGKGSVKEGSHPVIARARGYFRTGMRLRRVPTIGLWANNISVTCRAERRRKIEVMG